MKVLKIIPPFTYSYQCSSTLLTSYIPVYIYTFCLQIFEMTIRIFLYSMYDYSSFPQILLTHLPGIVWPFHWRLPVLHQPRPSTLLKVDKIITPIMNNLVILVTFGVCSPLLAFVIILTIYLTGQHWLFLIGRFFLLRIENSALIFGENEHEGCVQEILSIENAPSLASRDSLKDKEERYSKLFYPNDEYLLLVNSILEQTSGYYSICLWPILITSSLFFTCLAWDMAGDRVGWQGALWVPVCGFLMIPLLWIFNKIARYYYLQIQSNSTIRDEGNHVVSALYLD